VQLAANSVDGVRPRESDAGHQGGAERQAQAPVDELGRAGREPAEQTDDTERGSEGRQHHGENLDLGEGGGRGCVSMPGGGGAVGVELRGMDRGGDDARCIER
jgi:hypothetical protein